MATKIRIDLDSPVTDGQSLVFKSPGDCSYITGLIIYYPGGSSTIFDFADAHGNNVGSLNLFSKNALVKVLLDTKLNRAYVQNADTNAYLESELNKRASRVLLWENTDQKMSFEGFLPFSDFNSYDGFEIVYSNTSYGHPYSVLHSSGYLPVIPGNDSPFRLFAMSSSASHIYSRDVRVVHTQITGSGFKFETGYCKLLGSTSSDRGEPGGQYIIPLRIYGIKGSQTNLN